MNRKTIKSALKKSTKKDFSHLGDACLTDVMVDIMNLMYKGYQPEDYPDNEVLKRYRRGQRLRVLDISEALNVSESLILRHHAEMLDKIHRSGWLQKWRAQHGGDE